MSYVYVIGNAEGPVKVGLSTNPQSRLRTLRNATPVPIDVMACFHVGDYHAQLEGAIHLCLRDFRQSGEWFNATSDAAINAIERAAKIAELDITPVDHRTIERPSAGSRLLDAAHEMREGAGQKRGPKPKDDPKAVVTLRVEASVIERLPKDWRAQAAEFLRGLAS